MSILMMASKLGKDLSKTSHFIKKKPVKVLLLYITEIFFIITILMTVGFILSYIQNYLMDVVNLISIDPANIDSLTPSQTTVDSILSNSLELDMIFKSLFRYVVILAIAIYVLVGVSQFISLQIFNKGNLTKYLKVFSSYYVISLVLFILYLRLRFWIISFPLKIITEGTIDVIFWLVFLLLVYSFINSLTVNLWKEWKKNSFSTSSFTLFTLFIVIILVLMFLFSLFSNYIIAYTILFLIMIAIFDFYKLYIITNGYNITN